MSRERTLRSSTLWSAALAIAAACSGPSTPAAVAPELLRPVCEVEVHRGGDRAPEIRRYDTGGRLHEARSARRAEERTYDEAGRVHTIHIEEPEAGHRFASGRVAVFVTYEHGPAGPIRAELSHLRYRSLGPGRGFAREPDVVRRAERTWRYESGDPALVTTTIREGREVVESGTARFAGGRLRERAYVYATGTEREAFTYDDGGRLVRIVATSGDTEVATEIGHDGAGRAVRVTSRGGPGGAITVTFEYDDAGRLMRRVSVAGDEQRITVYRYGDGCRGAVEVIDPLARYVDDALWRIVFP